MIKSINQWSFPPAMSICQCLETAFAEGFEAFEPTIGTQGELSFQTPDKHILRIKEMAEEQGVGLSSLATGVYWNIPPTHDDRAVRGKALDCLKRQLEAAALLGVGAVLVVPGLVGAEFIPNAPVVRYDYAYERAQEFLAAAQPHAKATGVVIGIENVWNKFLLSPLEMRAFIDSFQSPFVQAYFDVGNVIAHGYPEHWVEILGGRIVRVHIKDFRRAVGTVDGFVDLLSGDVNFPAVMNALRNVGYDGFITAEMNGYKHYPDQAVRQTSAAMDRILGCE